MRMIYRLKRATSWLTLVLALLAGVVPSALADIDSSHFGGTSEVTSFHAHEGQPSISHGEEPSLQASDHHDGYCTDHCCSDACSAALNHRAVESSALKHPFVLTLSLLAELSPADERFIPPKII